MKVIFLGRILNDKSSIIDGLFFLGKFYVFLIRKFHIMKFFDCSKFYNFL